MNDKILISIIIPNWGEVDFARKLIDQIIKVDFPYEIIVSGQEKEYLLLKKYYSSHSKIHTVLAKSKNRSIIKNTLITKSTGNYLFFLDSSIFISTANLFKTFQSIQKSKADFYQLSVHPIGVPDNFYVAFKIRSNLSITERTFNSMWRPGHPLAFDTAALLIKKETLTKLNGYPNKLHRYEDRDLLLRSIDQIYEYIALTDIYVTKNYDRKKVMQLIKESLEDVLLKQISIVKGNPGSLYKINLQDIRNFVSLLTESCRLIFTSDKLNRKIGLFSFLYCVLSLIILIPLLPIYRLFSKGDSRQSIVINSATGESLEFNSLSSRK